MRRLLCLLAFVLLPVPRAAPVPDVDNPTVASWTASADHATIDGYTLELLRPDNTLLQAIDAGKPTPDAHNTCYLALNVQPISFGTGYSARVRARAGTAVSGWAISQNKFNRIPGRPGGPRFVEPMISATPAALRG